MDKIEHPDPEDEKRLNDKLKSINEELSSLTSKKQEIIDD